MVVAIHTVRRAALEPSPCCSAGAMDSPSLGNARALMLPKGMVAPRPEIVAESVVVAAAAAPPCLVHARASTSLREKRAAPCLATASTLSPTPGRGHEVARDLPLWFASAASLVGAPDAASPGMARAAPAAKAGSTTAISPEVAIASARLLQRRRPRKRPPRASAREPLQRWLPYRGCDRGPFPGIVRALVPGMAVRAPTPPVWIVDRAVASTHQYLYCY